MLTIEGRPSIIFGGGDARDCRQIVFTECVILLTKETFSPPVWLFRIDPIIHDPPAYERHNFGSFVPSMQQQPVAIVRPLVDDQLSERHWRLLACIDYRTGASSSTGRPRSFAGRPPRTTLPEGAIRPADPCGCEESERSVPSTLRFAPED